MHAYAVEASDLVFDVYTAFFEGELHKVGYEECTYLGLTNIDIISGILYISRERLPCILAFCRGGSYIISRSQNCIFNII